MRDHSIVCCVEPSPVPPKFGCIWSEIVEDYNELCKRYSKATTKCQQTRLQVLAEPKHSDKKYEDKCICSNYYSKVKIIDKTDQMTFTRTEQLALPKPRIISELKQHKSFDSFSDNRKSDVNRTLRKSLLSVYSRLMNVKHDEMESNYNIMDQHTKNILLKNIQRLSIPKKDHSLEMNRKSRDKGEPPTMKRLRRLAKPKTYPNLEPNQWVLTDALKHYRATERLVNMAKPKKNYAIKPIQVQPIDSSYRATARTRKLAEPQRKKSTTFDRIENQFQTNPRALKAVASSRVIELASARDYSDVHNRTNPYHISKGALKAKTSDRTRKLAEPKIRIG